MPCVFSPRLRKRSAKTKPLGHGARSRRDVIQERKSVVEAEKRLPTIWLTGRSLPRLIGLERNLNIRVVFAAERDQPFGVAYSCLAECLWSGSITDD